MRKLNSFLAAILVSFLFVSNAFSQGQDKLSIGVSLNHDAFFGFNPMLTGAYEVNDKTAFTFYGIQWGAGTASAWANWTEFGLGVNLKAGTFNINPQLGFTMGSLLSSGAANPGVIGDGIVPNITINHGSDKFEGQFYLGYYAALRDKTTAAGQATNNYIHYWANAGVKATSWMSIGAHYEQLYLSGGTTFNGGSLDRADGYTWLGPYVQFSNKNAGLRFSFGGNLDEGFAPNDFYKMAIFFNL
jgi:hypothetical protein